jgi:hypothetical protein
MYSRGLLGGGVGAASALPFTGLNIFWFALAAFTLLMAAGALWRVAPRSEA